MNRFGHMVNRLPGARRQRRWWPPARRSQPARRGQVLIYTVIAMAALVGISSLAVDLGRVELTKTELQRCADVTARGYMKYYILYGQTYANTNGPSLYSSTNNPVDGGSGVTPTVTVTWGYWNSGTNSFSSGVGSPVAVKVTVSRTKANNNAVPLTLGQIIGRSTCDVSVTAVAEQVGTSVNTGVTVPGHADPYLAGMPTGSTASVTDTTYIAAAYQVPTITVTPGSYITFTGISGSTNQGTGYALEGPGGWSGVSTNHTPGGGENGIGDATMWLDSFMGVFLGPNAPNTNSTPSAIDWTNASNYDQASYSNLVIQQPFYIGTGVNSGGKTKTFLVPPGATRLYLGSWDGYEWNNNSGSFTATVTVSPTVRLMQ